jgi:DNA primase
MTDRELVQRVKDATDLVALVGQTVKLRKQGSAHVGLCPFHSERSPSFQVVPARQFWHCFGCGKHGDALSWLQDRDGLTFGEALEQLARAAGIEVPRFKERPKGEVDLEQRLRAVMEAAQAFYARNLQQNPKALDYLRERGIAPAFAQEAGFGCAPEGWENLIPHLRQHGISIELIEQTGLASRTERGTLIDFLRDRLTIPIQDARGRIVAFGARAFGDAKPKYLNTRETALFHKGETLFGLHRAKGALRDGALVVEGYFDVLQLHQQGIFQAVAPLGTALTEDHLRVLGRFGKRLVLCFDGDAAGRNAMDKCLRLALPQGFDVRLLELPQGEDPDTWSLKLGAEGFREILRQAPGWVDFVLSEAGRDKDMKKSAHRMGIFQTFIDHYVFMPKTPENWTLLLSVAKGLDIPNSEVNRALNTRQGSIVRPLSERPVLAPNLQIDERLRTLVFLIREPWAREQVRQWPQAWWEGLNGAQLLQALLDADGEMDALPEEALADLRFIEANLSRRDETPTEKSLETLGNILEADFVQREIQALNRKIQEPSVLADRDFLRQIEARQASLLKRQSELRRAIRTVLRPPGGG